MDHIKIKQKNVKIGVVTSGGGHAFQITRLKWFFKKYSYFFVKCEKKDLIKIDKNVRSYRAFYPDSRNIPNFLRNVLLAIWIFNKEKPTILISCGAGIAVPFFFVGKWFFKTKLIFVEPYDFVEEPSMTGKLLYNRVNLFFVQHKKQKKWFPKAKYIGSLL